MDNFSKNSDSTYSLKLDIFEGPLDLLLTLIRDKDLDIYEISFNSGNTAISRVC